MMRAAVRTLFRATRVHTLSLPEVGEWILVDGRHVERVGVGDPPAADRVVDLPGVTIVPGFIDTHVHLTSTGLGLADGETVAAGSATALLDIARGRSGVGQGPLYMQGYDESRWAHPGLPTIDELDAASPRPLVIRRADGHIALANRTAIEQSGIADVAGVERGADGAPTGRITQEANDRLGLWAMSAITDHERQELQLKAAGLAASRGITTVHEMSMPHWTGGTDLDVFLGHRDRLPVDAVPAAATMDLSVAMEAGLGSIGGDLPTDGSIGARTAWVGEAYEDGGSGAPYHDDDQLAEFFHGGHVAGLQVGVHAIGDRAIEQVIGVWERVYHSLDSRQRRHFRARRHRIEHFEMPSVSQIERAAMLGLVASVQPAFDLYWGHPEGLYATGLGWDRAVSMNPFRTMLDRGIVVGVGSDAPITPLDPLLAVHALTTHHAVAQRLSRAEAIRLHTVGSARVGHQEAKKGMLAPGMHADLVAYEDDPMDAPDIGALAPVLTVSLGREVFAA